MTQHNSPGSASPLASASLDDTAILGAASGISEPEHDDWNDGGADWRRKPVGEPALTGLTPAQIRERHLRMLGELIEQTHPLASEYLTTAREVSPGAQGRDRIVGTGCKLSSLTNQLITTTARLSGD